MNISELKKSVRQIQYDLTSEVQTAVDKANVAFAEVISRFVGDDLELVERDMATPIRKDY